MVDATGLIHMGGQIYDPELLVPIARRGFEDNVMSTNPVGFAYHRDIRQIMIFFRLTGRAEMRTLYFLILLVTTFSCTSRDRIKHGEYSLPWEIVATSKNIIEGEIEHLSKDCRRETSCYLIASITIKDSLKGTIQDKNIEIIITDEKPLAPTIGNSYFFFLSEPFDPSESSTAIYLNEIFPDQSIKDESAVSSGELIELISDQQSILRKIDDELKRIPDTQCQRVTSLVNKIEKDGNAQFFLDHLDEVARSEIACLVREMENFDLTNGDIVEIWIEGHQLFYRPEKISDVIAITLNKATKRTFGIISNGDSSDEYRRNTINAWKIFLDKEGILESSGR